MVRARLFHRLRPGSFGERGIGKPRGKPVPFFLGRRYGFLQPDLLGIEINGSLERKGNGYAAYQYLRGTGGDHVGRDGRTDFGHSR